MKITTSKIFSLDWLDAAKGLLMAALAAGFMTAQELLDKGVDIFDWHLVGKAAVSGFLGYLIKNFFSPSKVVIKTGIESLPDFKLTPPPPDKPNETRN